MAKKSRPKDLNRLHEGFKGSVSPRPWEPADEEIGKAFAERLSEHGFFDGGSKHFLVTVSGCKHAPAMAVHAMEKAPSHIAIHFPFSIDEAVSQTREKISKLPKWFGQHAEHISEAEREATLKTMSFYSGAKERIADLQSKAPEDSPSGLIIGEPHTPDFDLDLPSPQELMDEGVEKVFIGREQSKEWGEAMQCTHEEGVNLEELVEQMDAGQIDLTNKSNNQLVSYLHRCKEAGLEVQIFGFDPRHSGDAGVEKAVEKLKQDR